MTDPYKSKLKNIEKNDYDILWEKFLRFQSSALTAGCGLTSAYYALCSDYELAGKRAIVFGISTVIFGVFTYFSNKKIKERREEIKSDLESRLDKQ
jgi:hypothetical protein